MASRDTVLRAAGEDDAPAIAEVLVAARCAAVAAGAMPASVHPASDMLRHVREDVLPHRDVWVAQSGEGADLVAVMALDVAWLDDLYVHPSAAGRGIGSALLQLAKAVRPDGFDLWVFEVNAPARRFYERHGLTVMERTDGADNPERAPDLRYRWPGGTSARPSVAKAVSDPGATVRLT